MTDVPQSPYQLVFFASANEQVRSSARRAQTVAIKTRFLGVVKAILAHLADDPLSWGEPFRHYRRMGLMRFRRLHEMVFVDYLVDDARKIVYVKECKPVLSHPLAEP